MYIKFIAVSCDWFNCILGDDTVTTRLTKKAIDELGPRERAYIEFDDALTGFGCRVMPSGVKTFIIEYRPGAGGRGVATKRLSIGRYGVLAPDQARKAAAEALAKVRLGADPAHEKSARRRAFTVTELIDAFTREHVESKLKASTAKSYGAGLEALRAAYGSHKAETISRSQLASLHTKMAATPYAANRAMAVWAKLFSWAEIRSLTPEGKNPARRIERYKESSRERFLTDDEMGRLGNAINDGETVGLPWQPSQSKHTPKSNRTKIDPFAVAAIRLLILTGARLREILDAQWSNFDPDRGILFLQDSKTGKKPVYLSAAALAVLEGLPRVKDNPYIIAGRSGARADLKKPWAAVQRVAGLEGVRLHDLRHSFASFGAGASIGLPIIGKLLGHKQAATTARYAHLDADPMHRAADAIGNKISSALARK